MTALAVQLVLLAATDLQAVDLPADATILGVHVRAGAVVLYVMGDPRAPTRRAHVLMVGTGQEIASTIARWPFVGSVKLDAELMLHVFADPATAVRR